MRIRRGKIIPRNDGKRIEELVGAATTATPSVSVARMLAPPYWREPAQTPEFDEVVCVLKGTLTLVTGGRAERITAGETGLVPRHTRVIYRNDANIACDYLSICAPAFRPDLAHTEVESVQAPPKVLVDVSHPSGRPFRTLLASRALEFLAELGQTGSELSVALVTDRGIQGLNRTWRKKDKATDVLSFPAGERPLGAPGPRPLGDVVISLDTAKRQAREAARPLAEELARYLAHGILHLLGYDHEKRADAAQMAAREEALLGSPGMVPAVAPRGPTQRRRAARRR